MVCERNGLRWSLNYNSSPEVCLQSMSNATQRNLRNYPKYSFFKSAVKGRGNYSRGNYSRGD